MKVWRRGDETPLSGLLRKAVWNSDKKVKPNFLNIHTSCMCIIYAN